MQSASKLQADKDQTAWDAFLFTDELPEDPSKTTEELFKRSRVYAHDQRPYYPRPESQKSTMTIVRSHENRDDQTVSFTLPEGRVSSIRDGCDTEELGGLHDFLSSNGLGEEASFITAVLDGTHAAGTSGVAISKNILWVGGTVGHDWTEEKQGKTFQLYKKDQYDGQEADYVIY